MNTTAKLFSKIILNILLGFISPREELQGFGKNRSITDAIFIIRQLVEKAIEFNRPASISPKLLIEGYMMLRSAFSSEAFLQEL